MAVSGEAATPFVRLAAHPVRWQLLEQLATGDYRVRDLVALLGQPQNLISYHLRLLRAGGLVRSARSSFDGRDTYYHMNIGHCIDAMAATGAALHPALRLSPGPVLPVSKWPPLSVLFVCTGNTARSPIAEALLRHHTSGHVAVISAGSHPRQQLHPLAVQVLRDGYSIEIGGSPRHLDTLLGYRFDKVITLCDKVREVCPEFLGHPDHVHWSIPDPAANGPSYRTFRDIAADIDTRVRYLLPVLAANAHPEVQP